MQLCSSVSFMITCTYGWLYRSTVALWNSFTQTMHESIKFKEFLTAKPPKIQDKHYKTMKNGYCWFSLLCSNSNKVAWGICSLSSQRVLQTDTRNITNILNISKQMNAISKMCSKPFRSKVFLKSVTTLWEIFNPTTNPNMYQSIYATLHYTALYYTARISKVFTLFMRIWFALFMRCFWCLSRKFQAKSETFSITNRENRQSMRNNVVVCVWMLENGELQT